MRPIEILLVEDNPTDRLLTIDALERSGLLNSLSVVEDGLDAMSYLRREGKFAAVRRPDLVLLDLNLPKKDGREVLAEVKADPRLKYIPVIVLTTSRSDEDLLRAYGHHANGYITKPLDFAQLADALRTLGGYWFNVVTLPADSAIERVPSESTASMPTVRSPIVHQVRALLIESVASVGSALQRVAASIEAPKFDLSIVSNFSAAQQALETETFDLILVNLQQAETQGIESYRRARRLAGSIPVVVIAPVAHDPIGLEALQEGADDVLAVHELLANAVTSTTRHVLERRFYREQLRRSQKLETLGRLVAGVAHDFNNLLSIVKGSTELLRKDTTDEATRGELVLGIHDAAERAGVIARQLLTFSRQRPMTPQRVDLNQVVGGISRLLRRMLGDTIDLELRLASELPPLTADPGMLDQVLLNLAINARDAMPHGGKLRVQTNAAHVEQSNCGLNDEGYPGHFVKLAVTDTGAGMSAEVLSRVFEPFFTTKSSGEGTGLGLAMVHGIVQQHRGWFDVRSEPGKGTTFEIYLPVSNVAAPTRTSLNPRPSLSVTPTILFVEEEAKLRALATKVLQQRGYRVLEASSEAEALSVWREAGKSVDLVVTEMTLPDGISGSHLADVLIRSRPALPFIFTGGSDRGAAETDRELEEGVDFLQKPYALSHLLSTVERCLAPPRAP